MNISSGSGDGHPGLQKGNVLLNRPLFIVEKNPRIDVLPSESKLPAKIELTIVSLKGDLPRCSALPWPGRSSSLTEFTEIMVRFFPITDGLQTYDAG